VNRVRAAQVFVAFAFTYFFSALLRAVTATLAPAFSAELGLRAADLGLLAGVYFLGFAAMQLPLGNALDRFGVRRVITVLLGVAVLGCVGFAQARSLGTLIAARGLIGVGVAACLMAPLTSFRQHFSSTAQLRANSWMLMTGSLGMVASTLPVQWLMPVLGWRGLFWVVAAMLVLCIAVIRIGVPADPRSPAVAGTGGYGAIWRHPLFLRMAPLGFFLYGGLIAIQSLWAGPWLTRVAGQSPVQAAQGLFMINVGMLLTFLAWGALMPALVRRGLHAVRIMSWGVPVSLTLLALNVFLVERAGALFWAAWCVSASVVSLSQPAVALAFPATLAGRALSAFNLVIFGGVFCLQWGIGLGVDALVADGWDERRAYQAAFALFWACCAVAYLAFVLAPRFLADNGRQIAST
jgi:MFS family permease